MNRAQEIRQKRLKARAIENEQREKQLKEKAEELFDWVLDLLENPTPNNTADTVRLFKGVNGKIIVGDDGGKETEKTFDMDVIEEIAAMFNEESGYRAQFIKSCEPRIIIRIE